MPIEYKKNQLLFRDIVVVDEAEGLLEWLQNKPNATLHLGACSHLHPANLQVLMASQTRVTVWPDDVRLRGWLETVLKSK